MANRLYNQFQFSHEKMPVTLYGRFLVGSTGAVSGVKGTGIASVTRNSAGNYTVAFVDGFDMLLASRFQCAKADASNVGNIQVWGTVATLRADVKTNKAITFQCLDFAGSAVDPASGHEVAMEFVFRNSSSVAPDAMA